MQVQPLFPIYQSADDYASKTGKPCPPCNSNFPLKNWEDTSLAPGVAGTYTFVVAGQTMPLAIQMTIQNAALVNLPTPVVVYHPYVVPATNATENGAPANPKDLSTEDDAKMLIASVVASGCALNVGYRLANPGEQGMIINGADGRKVWILTGSDPSGANQLEDFVGWDISEMYEYGVGAPGAWSINIVTPGVAELQWKRGPNQSQTNGMITPAAGSTPIPIVPLPVGATLAATSMSIFDPLQAVIVPAATGPSQMELDILELFALLKANGISAPTL